MKYMSIITNFGCHYKCPYCIVKENNLHIPKTTYLLNTSAVVTPRLRRPSTLPLTLLV